MKKKLCIFLLMSISVTTFGQVIPKGTRFIGGDLNFDSYSNKNSNDSKGNISFLNIRPSITYFKKDNFAITYSLGYGLSLSKSSASAIDGVSRSMEHAISAGLYFTNYQMFSEKFGVSLQYGGILGYSTGRTTYKSPTVTIKSDPINGVNLSFTAGPGIIYLLNEKFALEGNASLVNLSIRYGGNNNTSNFQIGTNLSASPGLGIGFRYFLK